MSAKVARGTSTFKKVLYGTAFATVLLLAWECLLALLGVETTLADHDPYVGFESTIPLFVKQRADDGADVYRTAPNKLAFFNQQQFPKDKAGRVRIFCVGGSTTFGRPYDDRTSFAAWLRELLPAADGAQQWEVINAGGISYASYRVAAVIEELCDYDPDVFVVYTGNNEFLEERTYRSVVETPALVRRMTAPLHHTRTFSMLTRVLSPSQPGVSEILPAEVDAMLDHTVGPDSYHRNDELSRQILAHLEFNLERMIQLARNSGAEIVFVKPAVNLKDFSPFKSEHRPGLTETEQQEWLRLVDESETLEHSDQLDEAYRTIQLAEAIDDRYAELHYRKGKILVALEHHRDARLAFQRAVEEDVCPLRAQPAIQELLERVAIAARVPLVDFDDVLRHDCEHHFGYPAVGAEYFVDHVHPTIASNRLLALAIIEAMVQRKIVHATSNWRETTIAEVSLRIESRLDPELQSQALTNLAQVLSWAGKQKEAGPLAAEAVRVRAELNLPEDPESLFYAGVHYAMTGADDQAIRCLQAVVHHVPDHSEAHWRLAALLVDRREWKSAEHHLREAIRVNPDDAESRKMLDAVLEKLASGKHPSDPLPD